MLLRTISSIAGPLNALNMPELQLFKLVCITELIRILDNSWKLSCFFRISCNLVLVLKALRGRQVVPADNDKLRQSELMDVLFDNF